MSQRTDRVDELLREEIGAILTRDVKDPRVGFVTITDVETTPDLRHARVWVSVIGPGSDRAATLAALDRAMGYVRHELGRRLRIRRIPELHVRLDESSERGTRLLRLISELGEGSVPEDLPEGETLPTPVPRIRQPGDVEETIEPPVGESRTVPGRGREGGRRGGARRPAQRVDRRPGGGPADRRRQGR
jgi:ribosome-binding factor A